MAALAVVVLLAAGSAGASDPGRLVMAMATISAWIVAPSMILTVISGLLAMAVNPAFYEVGWVWLKAASGILVLEGGLHVLGPIQDEARRRIGTPSSVLDPASVSGMLASEANTLWVLLAVSVANIVLGVWRPRFSKGGS